MSLRDSFLFLLFGVAGFHRAVGALDTGLLVVGGESAELWTPENSFEPKHFHEAQISVKEFNHAWSDSCNLPPPPSPMFGHTVDLVDDTIVLVHGDASYHLDYQGWSQGPNTIYNRSVPRAIGNYNRQKHPPLKLVNID